MHRLALCLTVCAACSSRQDAPLISAPRDAGEPEDPHELGPDPSAELPIRPARPAPARAGRPIEIILRSTPPGATAAVDGVPVGVTPTYWAGDANGKDHEFLFARHGYAYARYRFVPITSGVVHARLEPIADDGHPSIPPELLRPPEPATPPPAVPPPAVDRDPTTGPGPQP